MSDENELENSACDTDDTVDTDTLLSSDPTGGLDMFLGLSLKELSEKHQRLSLNSDGIISSIPKTKPTNTKSKIKTTKTATSTCDNGDVDDVDKDLDRSHFLNSQGKIVLPDLPEWTDSSSSDSERERDDDDGDGQTQTRSFVPSISLSERQEYDGDGADSDGGSEASFTYTPTPTSARSEEASTSTTLNPPPSTTSAIARRNGSGDRKGDKDDNQAQIVQTVQMNGEGDNASSAMAKLHLSGRKLKENLMEMPGSERINGFGFEFPSSHSHSQQSHQAFLDQVVDINLSHPAAGWNIPLPKFPHLSHGDVAIGEDGQQEQIFTRAPNFRTPGGYKPRPQNQNENQNPPLSRHLTEEQLREEVRKLYANPESEPDQDQEEPESQKSDILEKEKDKRTRVLRFAAEVQEIQDQEASEVKVNVKTKTSGGKRQFNSDSTSNPNPKLVSNSKKEKENDTIDEGNKKHGTQNQNQHQNQGKGRRRSRKKASAKTTNTNTNNKGKFDGAGDCITSDTSMSVSLASATENENSISISTDSNPNSKSKSISLPLPQEVKDFNFNCASNSNTQNPPVPAEIKTSNPEVLPLTTTSSVPYCTRVVRGKKAKKKTSSSHRSVSASYSNRSGSASGSGSRFSFGYGESDGGDNGVSPIRSNPNQSHVLRTPSTSADTSNSPPVSVPGSSFGIDELKSIWKEIQFSRQLMNRAAGSDGRGYIEDLGAVTEEHQNQPPDTPEEAEAHPEPLTTNSANSNSNPIRKSSLKTKPSTETESNPKTKNGISISELPPMSPPTIATGKPTSHQNQHQHQQQTFNHFNANVNQNQNRNPVLEEFASDLDIILQEADIHPQDFEDLIGDIDTADCDYGLGIQDLLDEIIVDPADRDREGGTVGGGDDLGLDDDDPDGPRLSEWARSGAVEYVEKYHEEKFRREECEGRINEMGKTLLEFQERNAVLEGQMKRKEQLLQQITLSWKKYSRESKIQEKTTTEEMHRLKSQLEVVLKASEENKQRVEEYEQELLKTVDLAEGFKVKLAESQQVATKAVESLHQEKTKLGEIIERMETQLAQLQDEKQTAVRALKESQILFDDQKSLLTSIEVELTCLKKESQEQRLQLEDSTREKKRLESFLQQRSLRIQEQDTKVQELTRKTEKLEEEKESLRVELEHWSEERLKEEGERLHNYYNEKLQEALKSATEKAAKTQTTLLESMRNSSAESERKLSEFRSRHQSDLARMKAIFEAEIQLLKKDNVQKQLLISTTAQQLQRGDLARSGAVNRIQNLVSTMPTTTSTPPTSPKSKSKVSKEIDIDRIPTNKEADRRVRDIDIGNIDTEGFGSKYNLNLDKFSSLKAMKELKLTSSGSGSYQYCKTKTNPNSGGGCFSDLLVNDKDNLRGSGEISKLFPSKFGPRSHPQRGEGEGVSGLRLETENRNLEIPSSIKSQSSNTKTKGGSNSNSRES